MTTRQDDQYAALVEVQAELDRQYAKWNEQNHPDGTGIATRPLRGMATAHYAETGADFVPSEVRALALMDDAKVWCQRRALIGDVTWTDILLEEVFEALAEEPGSAELRAELIQTAAVAVQWALAIDRKNGADR